MCLVYVRTGLGLFLRCREANLLQKEVERRGAETSGECKYLQHTAPLQHPPGYLKTSDD